MSDGQLVWFRYLAQVAAHACVLHLVLFMSDGQLIWFHHQHSWRHSCDLLSLDSRSAAAQQDTGCVLQHVDDLKSNPALQVCPGFATAGPMGVVQVGCWHQENL